jgi:guanylate kinase
VTGDSRDGHRVTSAATAPPVASSAAGASRVPGSPGTEERSRLDHTPPSTSGQVHGAAGAMLLIISGPSGVGKDTIITALRERHPRPTYHFVVTCTTRPPRDDEIDGSSYHFISRKEFVQLRDGGELLEWAQVHGNWYGTPRGEVRDMLVRGRDVVLKIDVQGAQVVKESVPDALLIFVVPPTLEALFQRLRSRATESAEELEVRQRNAAIELARQGDYDYVVTNETDQVDRTAQRIDEILAVEHALRADRRVVV